MRVRSAIPEIPLDRVHVLCVDRVHQLADGSPWSNGVDVRVGLTNLLSSSETLLGRLVCTARVVDVLEIPGSEVGMELERVWMRSHMTIGTLVMVWDLERQVLRRLVRIHVIVHLRLHVRIVDGVLHAVLPGLCV